MFFPNESMRLRVNLQLYSHHYTFSLYQILAVTHRATINIVTGVYMNFMVWGHHNVMNYIKGHSIKKVENHWPRGSGYVVSSRNIHSMPVCREWAVVRIEAGDAVGREY